MAPWSPRVQILTALQRLLDVLATLTKDTEAGAFCWGSKHAERAGAEVLQTPWLTGVCQAQGSPPSSAGCSSRQSLRLPSKARKPLTRALTSLMKRVPCTAEPSACDSGGHSHRGALSCGGAAVGTGGPEVPHVSGPRGACPDSRPPSPVPGTHGSPRC